ncbi:iron-containing redox enzyme family protein [Actinomadura rayongensis]|uniref:Iron-containing redox enzyme family protein n=1 Tax=Actinomadura rayongensis TaxID=1429076 RepID=A0A6I4W7L6_9ACTN|nr:iron-containing redox enzyme family protein [Actinomadura rayongensis]MXQ64196.1 iron-containing redox enzyme family protein [Actinomadura rayongensis]
MTADLPAPRGPLSEALLEVLRGPAGTPAAEKALGAAPAADDPFGDDLHLALHLCYELHYQGLTGVDAGWEWDPALLGLRATLEQAFLAELRDGTPGKDVHDVLDALLIEHLDARGPSHHLRDKGEMWQMREYLVHRSIYQLKESDPQAFAVPRLAGPPKAALAAVQYDEFGGGNAERMHARLFADLMEEADLDPSYGAYVDVVPAPMLAITNMMSLFALHRALRGAILGHFAVLEITSSPGSERMCRALRRLGVAERGVRFYAEHVEADAVHEQVLRRDVIGGLLDAEPELAPDVALGAEATVLLEDRLDGHLLGSWDAGRTSLLRPL